MIIQARYVPVPRELFGTGDPHWLMQELAAHVERLLGANWHPPENVERIVDVPPAVKVAWYLWWFQCEVVGNGFMGYLGNGSASAYEIQKVREALIEVGAAKLARLFDVGIVLCKKYDAAFWREENAAALFARLEAEGPWEDLGDLDEEAVHLADKLLDQGVDRYLHTMADEL